MPPQRVDAIVDQLMGTTLGSGWGVRTMSTADAGYNPLAYHNGTVWPHDNSPFAGDSRAALAGRRRSASSQRMLSAAAPLRLPAARGLRGDAALRDAVSDRVPHRGAPAGLGGRHAGAAPAVPARACSRTGGATPLESVAPIELPSWAGTIRLSGVRAFERLWDVRLEEGRVSVEAGLDAHRDPRPGLVRRPPSGYGGIEWVVSLLADGLADAGHDVTLFASGDSRTKAKLAAVFRRRRAIRSGGRSGS